ncbi:hypothetical protein E2K80_14580 [Rhodophyticola sp. CCM32]|uniref:exopolysaccharide transport family protein n=1 Tax=Rhodophyticola sp. CCM32 TaxID=2916397 RepID=UPI00107FBA50|nr:exopolysaccharide transport family protein [Rhodophyticola sp. CCM32]QBY01796.1 hypothetical protein E2K80_14580 [Rhodophyticola sp. CCM32]
MDEFNRAGRRSPRFRPPTLLLTPGDGHSGGTTGQQQAPLFDFAAVWRLLRRRIGMIVVFTMVCIAITVFLHSLSPKVYSAHTRVLLDEQNVNPFGNDEIFADLRLTNPVVESQMQVMRAPYLLSQVVDRLNLSENADFMAEPTTPMRERLSALRGAILSGNDEAPAPVSEAEQFQAAVDRLRDNLRVSRNAQTLVIRIEFTSASPELAANVVNAVAESYIDNRLDLRQNTAERAGEWFDDRMAELNARALEAEQRIERLSGGGTEALDASQSAATLQAARQQLQDSMAQRARARTEALRLQTILDSGRGLRGVPSSLATGAIRTLMDEAAIARSELAEALLAEPADAAHIETLQARLDSLDAAGTSLLSSLLQDAETRAAEAEEAETAAQAAFEAARVAGGGSVTNSIEVELRTLEGEARIYRELHDSYLESYLRTIQQQSFPSTEATIIEVARIPEFSDNPGLSRLGLLAVLVGLTLGAGGAFLVEAADGRVRTMSQLSRAAGAPVLGILPSRGNDRPHVPGRSPQLKLPAIRQPHRTRKTGQEIIALPENRVSLTKDAPQMYAAISNPLSHYSESIRRVKVEADNVQALLEEDHRNTRIIGFISDQESRGRSIAAVNYAEMLAVGGSQTLLIDFDWTGLFLTEKITPAAQFGLADLAMPNADSKSEQAFWYDERTSLYFLPNRSLAKDAALDPGVFDQTRLKALVLALAGKFDNVVFDLSPLSASSDAAAMAEIVSGFVAVAEWGETKSSSLAAELRRASIYPPKLLGTLLNGVSTKQLEKYATAA